MTANLDIAASAITFPEFTTTVSGVVERTTPADINSAVTVDVGTAGLTRTGFTVAISSAFVFDSVVDIFIIKAVDDSRIFVEPAKTKTYLIPQQLRTHTLDAESRTHVIDQQNRIIAVDQQTRTTQVEAL